jgi:small neutral amino acid transporter SnatA (MarC family)
VGHAAEIACGLVLTLMALQMLVVISRKSITNDEIVLIPSAYYHLVGDN